MPSHFHQKPNTYVSHVQIKVSNLNQSVKYYQDIIGFNLLEKNDQTAILTTDRKRSILSLEQVNGTPLRRGQTGLYHFAILLPSRKDLGNFIQHIAELNIRIGAGDHHVSEAIYLYDPDGNGIEVYADRPEEQWIWQNEETIYMTTEQVNIRSLLAEADGQWNGLPDDTVMGHIHLSVSDLAKSEEFYTKALGFDVVLRYGSQALFISTGKYHHHIGLNTWESLGGLPAPKNSVGLKSFTLVLNDEAHAETIKRNLQEIGAVVTLFDEAPKFGGSQIFSTVDPSGIRIVFTLDEE